jgi:hypothetical protein
MHKKSTPIGGGTKNQHENNTLREKYKRPNLNHGKFLPCQGEPNRTYY